MAPHSGILQYQISYAKKDCCIKLLLYLHDDVDKMRAHMNCLQKLGVLDPRSNQVITLSPTTESSGCTSNETVRNGREMIDCKSGRKLSSALTLRWSIAVSSCGLPKGLDISYRIIIHGYVGTCPTNVNHASKIDKFTVSIMVWTVIFTFLMRLN
ncbi:unnamed protein product [Dimorphilus gyrociliatus]|nr:unnamed protein product [Dimorphilus gyrociliatus]